MGAKMRKENRQKGFTLIELIAVLLIVGVLAAFAGLGIVAAVQGYMFSKDNAVNSEKAQLALSHLNRELVECYNCKYVGPGTTAISSPFDYYNPLGSRRMTWGGGGLTVIQLSDGTSTDTLIDNVSSFSLAYNTTDKCIDVTMSLTGVPNSFSTKIYPRNTP